jgi:DNA-binding transcriptional LysR family regulator
MRSMTGNLLPRALLRFSKLHPNVTVRAVEGYSRELVGQVSSGLLDFAVATALADTKELPSRPFLHIGEALVARAGHPMLAAGKVNLRRRKDDLQLIIPGPENMRREHVLSYFRANGIRTGRTLEIDTVSGTLGVIKESEWMSVLPLISIPDAERSGLIVQPILDPPLTLDVIVIEPAGRQLSAASEEFLRVLSAETASTISKYKPPRRSFGSGWCPS